MNRLVAEIGASVAVILGLQYALLPVADVVLPAELPTIVTLGIAVGAFPLAVGFVGRAVSGVRLENLMLGGVVALGAWLAVADDVLPLFGPVHAAMYVVFVGALVVGAAVETTVR
jgi:hypothetical protein